MTNTHEHKCTSCQHTFSHNDSCFDNKAEHMCPKCGAGPFWNKIMNKQDEDQSVYVDLIEKHFEDLGMSSVDVSKAVLKVTVTLMALASMNIPLHDKGMPEVLRVIANYLDLKFKK